MITAKSLTRRAALLLLPLTLAAGCASNLKPSGKAEAPAIPPLAKEARQPSPPKICTQWCSDGLMKLRTKLLDSLTKAAPPADSANETTTR